MQKLALALLVVAPTFAACAFNEDGQLVPASQVPPRCMSNCPEAPPLLLHHMESGEMTYGAEAAIEPAAKGAYLIAVTGAMATPQISTALQVVMGDRNQLVLRVGDVTQAFVDVRSTQAGLSNSARLSLNVQDVASLSIEPLRYNVLPNTEFAYLRDHVYGIVTLRSANDSKLGDNSMVIVGDGVSQERWDSFSYVGAAGTHTVQVAADSLSTIRTLSFTTVAQTESATLAHEPNLSSATAYVLCAHGMAGTSEVVTTWKFVATGRRNINHNCMSLPISAGPVHVTATAEDGRVLEQDVTTM
jgi:hypothetical protein